MEKRRAISSRHVTPCPSPLPTGLKRRISGMTMWLDTIIESAMDSRMIIEVADEKPPIKAKSASASWPKA